MKIKDWIYEKILVGSVVRQRHRDASAHAASPVVRTDQSAVLSDTVVRDDDSVSTEAGKAILKELFSFWPLAIVLVIIGVFLSGPPDKTNYRCMRVPVDLAP